MLRQFCMAEVTAKIFLAAGKLDRHNIVRPVIMRTSRFGVDIDASDFDTADYAPHAVLPRGQIRTNPEPIIQHAIIMTRPALNEPVL